MEKSRHYAVIDIGSNSVRCMEGWQEAGDWHFGPKILETTRLGQHIDQTGCLSNEGKEATLAVFSQWSRQLKGLPVCAVATSAVREAADGLEFMEEVRQLGWQAQIISGEEEARLSFCGAASTVSAQKAVVMDIGGGSTEIAAGNHGNVQWSHSYLLGAVRLSPGRLLTAGEIAQLEQRCYEAWLDMPFIPEVLIGVGGTLTSLAAIDQELEPYDPARVDGYHVSLERLSYHIERICAMPLAQRRNIKGLQAKRGDIIAAGLLIARSFLRRYRLETIRVSERDLMEGIFLQKSFHNGPDSV